MSQKAARKINDDVSTSFFSNRVYESRTPEELLPSLIHCFGQLYQQPCRTVIECSQHTQYQQRCKQQWQIKLFSRNLHQGTQALISTSHKFSDQRACNRKRQAGAYAS